MKAEIERPDIRIFAPKCVVANLNTTGAGTHVKRSGILLEIQLIPRNNEKQLQTPLDESKVKQEFKSFADSKLNCDTVITRR